MAPVIQERTSWAAMELSFVNSSVASATGNVCIVRAASEPFGSGRLYWCWFVYNLFVTGLRGMVRAGARFVVADVTSIG